MIATAPRTTDRQAVIERFRAVGGDQAAAAMARSFREQTVEAETEWMRVSAPLTTHAMIRTFVQRVTPGHQPSQNRPGAVSNPSRSPRSAT